MSNITVFNPNQMPAFAKKGELTAVARALAGGVAGGGVKRISVKGGVFRLISDGKELAAIDDRHLDVVIVNAAPKVSRTFYARTFEEGSPTAPDCWSNDGDKPDASIKAPQGPSCANCPQNIAGSGQGTSRACRFSQRLAVVLANDMEGDVLQLTLSATSIFGKEDGDNRPLQAYARYLVAQGADPSYVVTRMRFDTKAATPKLFFKAMRWLTDDEHASTAKQADTEEAKRAITMTVAQVDKVAQVPAPADPAIAGAKPKAKTKAADILNASLDDDGDEPNLRKEAAKPSAVPKKGSLIDMVSDWDTDD